MWAAVPEVEHPLGKDRYAASWSSHQLETNIGIRDSKRQVRAKERQENLGERPRNRHNQRRSGTKIEIQRKKGVSQRHRDQEM